MFYQLETILGGYGLAWISHLRWEVEYDLLTDNHMCVFTVYNLYSLYLLRKLVAEARFVLRLANVNPARRQNFHGQIRAQAQTRPWCHGPVRQEGVGAAPRNLDST